MKTLLLFIFTIFIAVGVSAEDSEAVNRLAEIRAELRIVFAKAKTAPATIELEKKVEEARKAFERTEQEIPGVSEINASMADAREILRSLQREKNAKLRANAVELDAKQKELEEAEDSYGDARRGGEKGLALLLERNALLKELEPEIPVPDLSDSGKTEETEI